MLEGQSLLKALPVLISVAAVLLHQSGVAEGTCGCTAAASSAMLASQHSPVPATAPATSEGPTAASSPQPDSSFRIIEGDIMISVPAQQQQGKPANSTQIQSDSPLYASTSAKSTYWPNGTLHYSLSSEYTASEAEFIAKSLLELQLYVGSAVVFKRVSPGDVTDYVAVSSGSGCSSYVGRQTGAQSLSLQRSVCLQKYIIQHEFIHALGFWHEQSRSDRDQFVTIWWSNIDSGKCDNFGIFGSPPPTGYPAYDTTSIMHYDSLAFTCDSRFVTITTKSSALIAYPMKLASSDQKRIQFYYGAGDNTTISLSSNDSASSCNPSAFVSAITATWIISMYKMR